MSASRDMGNVESRPLVCDCFVREGSDKAIHLHGVCGKKQRAWTESTLGGLRRHHSRRPFPRAYVSSRTRGWNVEIPLQSRSRLGWDGPRGSGRKPSRSRVMITPIDYRRTDRISVRIRVGAYFDPACHLSRPTHVRYPYRHKIDPTRVSSEVRSPIRDRLRPCMFVLQIFDNKTVVTRWVVV